MNAGFLSPNQFEKIADFIDTIIITSYDESPLDAASPMQGGWLIGQQLAERLNERLTGRLTRWTGGTTRVTPPSPEALKRAADGIPHLVRFGILVTDRVLLRPLERCEDVGGVRWILFDWWQWVHFNVPEGRRADAWLYLCCACTLYLHSEACAKVGWSTDVLQGMANEGNRLIEVMVEHLAQAVQEEWSTPQ